MRAQAPPQIARGTLGLGVSPPLSRVTGPGLLANTRVADKQPPITASPPLVPLSALPHLNHSILTVTQIKKYGVNSDFSFSHPTMNQFYWLYLQIYTESKHFYQTGPSLIIFVWITEIVCLMVFCFLAPSPLRYVVNIAGHLTLLKCKPLGSKTYKGFSMSIQ